MIIVQKLKVLLLPCQIEIQLLTYFIFFGFQFLIEWCIVMATGTSLTVWIIPGTLSPEHKLNKG